MVVKCVCVYKFIVHVYYACMQIVCTAETLTNYKGPTKLLLAIRCFLSGLAYYEYTTTVNQMMLEISLY